MDEALKTQLDIKQNAEELQRYLSELKVWEQEIKQMEKKISVTAVEDQDFPPPRNVAKKRLGNSDNGKEEKKRISGSDYKSWDKFDVEKACQEIDDPEEDDAILEEDDTILEEHEGETNRSATHMEEKDCLRNESSKEEGLTHIHSDEAYFQKQLGNKYVKESKWEDALNCYSKAIELEPYNAIFHANRSLCFLKLSNFKAAEVDSTVALQLDPTYIKAYQRRAFARKSLKQFAEAKADWRKVLELEPTNSQAKGEIIKIESASFKNATSSFNAKEIFAFKAKKTKNSTIVSPKKQEDSKSTKREIKVAKYKKEGGKEIVPANKADVHNVPVRKVASSTKSKGIPAGWTQVEPIDKPVHLRSKVPLRKVLVTSVNSSTGIERSSEAGFLCDTGISLENSPIKPQLSITEDASKTEVSSAPQKLVCPTIAQVPEVPQTCVQFQKSWKLVCNDSNLAYAFLKQIPLAALPKVFGSGLESDLLSQLVFALAQEPILKDESFLFDFLSYLTTVERFKSLVLFMSDADKNALRTCFKTMESCETKLGNLEELQNKYDLD